MKSGRDTDKWKEAHLTPVPGKAVKSASYKGKPGESGMQVRQAMALGSHTMFVAEVVSVGVDEAYLDKNNRFHLEKADPVCYSTACILPWARQ